MVYVISSSLNCCKDIIFFYNLDRQNFSAKCLAYIGSVLLHSFDDNMLLHLSVEFLMRSPARNYVTMYQSSLVLSTKQWKVEFDPINRALNICVK